MSPATVTNLSEFSDRLETERTKPVQRNLFTGEAERSYIEVPDAIPDDVITVIDEGISVVKTDDLAQLIVSGFGLRH